MSGNVLKLGIPKGSLEEATVKLLLGQGTILGFKADPISPALMMSKLNVC